MSNYNKIIKNILGKNKKVYKINHYILNYLIFNVLFWLLKLNLPLSYLPPSISYFVLILSLAA